MKPRLPIDCEPGDLCDSKGYSIHPGDLLRTYHYTDHRRRKHWLYHVVTRDADHPNVLEMTPVGWLALDDRGRRLSGGKCRVHSVADEDGFVDAEILTGHGPGKLLCFTDRPKRRRPQPKQGA